MNRFYSYSLYAHWGFGVTCETDKCVTGPTNNYFCPETVSLGSLASVDYEDGVWERGGVGSLDNVTRMSRSRCFYKSQSFVRKDDELEL